MNVHIFQLVQSNYEHRAICEADGELSILSAYQDIVDSADVRVGELILISGQYLKLTAKSPCRFQVLHPKRPELRGLKEAAARIEEQPGTAA